MGTEEEKVMRIALCVSGQPRRCTEGYEGIKKNIIDFNESKGHRIDTFIHAWRERDSKDVVGAAHSLIDVEKTGGQCAAPGGFNTILESPELLIDIYEPIAFQLEKQVPFDPFRYKVPQDLGYRPDGRPCFNQQSMFYSIWACNSLKRLREVSGDFVYDAVIRIRPDCRVTYPVDISSLNLDKLYHRADTPPGGVDPRVPNWPGKMNDHFAISNSTNMDIYSNCYLALQDLYNSGVPFNPEFCLGVWVDHNKIQRDVFEYNELRHEVSSAIIR
jgi:hypothetical protein